MEEIFITGSIARSIRRMARRNLGVKLELAEVTKVTPLSGKHITLGSLGLDSLRTSLGIEDERLFDLRVPAPGSRLRAQGIRNHVSSLQFPPRSFDLVLPAQGNPLQLPHDIRILIDSPLLTFATVARQLQKSVTAGAIDEMRAGLLLFRHGVEDCSSYSLDPWHPGSGNCIYGCEPCMSAEDLRAYLAELHRYPGCPFAREVAEWVFDGSASPMESLVNAAFSLPLKLGSLNLGAPVANKTIQLTEVQRLKLNHIDHITPDLLWEALVIVVEYLGAEPHAGVHAHQEDVERVQDYQSLGYLVFPVLFRHVRNPTEFNKLAMRIAAAMEQRGARGAVAWVEELVSDESFLARQREMFAVMLPAVFRR